MVVSPLVRLFPVETRFIRILRGREKMAWSVFVRRQVQRKQQKQQYQMQKMHLLVVAWLENLCGPIFGSEMHHNTPGNWNTVIKGLGVVIKMGLGVGSGVASHGFWIWTFATFCLQWWDFENSKFGGTVHQTILKTRSSPADPDLKPIFGSQKNLGPKCKYCKIFSMLYIYIYSQSVRPMSTAELSLLKSHLTWREYDVCKFWIIHVTSAVAPSFHSTAWFWKRQCDWPRIRLSGTLADARKECQPTDNQYEASIKEMKKEVWIIWQMQPVPFRAVQWARFFKQMQKDALCKCLYRCVLFETPSETKSIKVWKPMQTRWSFHALGGQHPCLMRECSPHCSPGPHAPFFLSPFFSFARHVLRY